MSSNLDFGVCTMNSVSCQKLSPENHNRR